MSGPTKKRSYTRRPEPLVHNVPPSNVLFTNKEAAAFLRMGVRMLKYYRDLGLIPFIQKGKRGRVLFDRTDLEQFLLYFKHVGKLVA